MNEARLLKWIVGLCIALFLSLVGLGALFVVVLNDPTWLVGWLSSIMGPEPKAFWYLSRASGLVAYLLMWLSLVVGLSITSRLARLWPGGPSAVDLHQFTGLLGLGFATFHGLILLGDHYIGYTLSQILVPFASGEYRPLWVGIGQVSFYLAVLVSLTFYVRRFIGYRVWRTLHFGTFVVYALVTLHSLTAGTDTLTWPALLMYLVTVSITGGLILYRLLTTIPQARRALS